MPSGPNAGDFKPLSLKDLTKNMGKTGGPIVGHFEATPEGAGVSFATHIVDAEVDPETGKTKILRYTCLLYTSPSPRDQRGSRMPSSA